jgi:hypothetical protein
MWMIISKGRGVDHFQGRRFEGDPGVCIREEAELVELDEEKFVFEV